MSKWIIWKLDPLILDLTEFREQPMIQKNIGKFLYILYILIGNRLLDKSLKSLLGWWNNSVNWNLLVNSTMLGMSESVDSQWPEQLGNCHILIYKY